MPGSLRCAAIGAIRRPAHAGHNPRRLQLQGPSSAGGPCPSPGAASHRQASHTAENPKMRLGPRLASRWPRGRHGLRRGRAPGAPRPGGRAPSGWALRVPRWSPLAPDEPPQTAGREGTGQQLPPTIRLICSAYKPKVDLGIRRQPAGHTAVPRLGVVRVVAAVAKGRLKFLYTHPCCSVYSGILVEHILPYDCLPRQRWRILYQAIMGFYPGATIAYYVAGVVQKPTSSI